MKAKLHKPHGSNRYCGPTALSVLTGLSTDDAAAVVRLVCPEKSRGVRGMHDHQIVKVVDKLGGHTTFAGVRSSMKPKQTLKQWLEARPEKLRNRTLIVSAGHHYMVARGDLLLCNQTKGELVHLLSHPYANKRFQTALLIDLPEKVKLPDELKTKRKAQAKRRSATASAGAAARRLAARLHLEFEKDDPFIITSMAESGTEFWREVLNKRRADRDRLPPDADYEAVRRAFYDEVMEGSSYGHDWREALDHVERVAEYLKQVTGVDVTGARGVIG